MRKTPGAIPQIIVSIAVLAASIYFFAPRVAKADTVIFVTSTSLTSWTVPADWSASNTIEVIGGGGNGVGSSGGTGAGGGGGGYAMSVNQFLTPGATVGIKVGVVASDTFVCNATSNCATIGGTAVIAGAEGGTSAAGTTAGTGGATSTEVALGTGALKFKGGNGASAGGGGGAASPNGSGGNASGATGGSSGSGVAGGSGGNSCTPGTNGTEWSTSPAYGAGSGGGGKTGGGGAAGCAGGTYGAAGGTGNKNTTAQGGQQGIIVITYTPMPGAPGTPTYSNIGPTTLTINWASATNANYYKIERSTDGISFSQIATTTSLSYNDFRLMASTTYYYWVRGTNGVGDGPYSASSSVTTARALVGFAVQDAVLGGFGGYASSPDFQIISGGTPLINGNAISANFNSATGPVNYSDFAPVSQTWRWYGDANDETPTTTLASENAAPSSITDGQVIKLRVDIKEASGVMGSADFKPSLQFAQSSDFTVAPGSVAETGNCSATSTWCYATSTGGNDNQVISTKVLSTSDACASGVGLGCGTHNTSGISVSTSTQSAGATTEYEFTIMASGVSSNNTYFFRLINTVDGSVIPAGATSSYPSLIIQGATFSFSVSGLPQSTSTNGVVTNIATTATGIPFGTILLGTSTIAAQRLTITTNASNGYEIYTVQDQQLADARGDQVPGVAGTNLSPLAWASGCTGSATGCYGYHAGSPVLSGGSTRFAANDSYAALTSTIAEVGYGGAPASGTTMDMVYRIQIAGNQGTGAYQNNIMYIVAPSF